MCHLLLVVTVAAMLLDANVARRRVSKPNAHSAQPAAALCGAPGTRDTRDIPVPY
jgi:hypothetical protein